MVVTRGYGVGWGRKKGDALRLQIYIYTYAYAYTYNIYIHILPGSVLGFLGPGNIIIREKQIQIKQAYVKYKV